MTFACLPGRWDALTCPPLQNFWTIDSYVWDSVMDKYVGCWEDVYVYALCEYVYVVWVYDETSERTQAIKRMVEGLKNDEAAWFRKTCLLSVTSRSQTNIEGRIINTDTHSHMPLRWSLVKLISDEWAYQICKDMFGLKCGQCTQCDCFGSKRNRWICGCI